MRVASFLSRFRILRAASLILFVFLAATTNAAFFHKPKPENPAPKDFDRDIKPLLEKHCYGCHGEAKQKGSLSLESFPNIESILKNKPVWEKVLHNLQNGEMPPENKPQPTDAERKLLIHWIEAEVFNCDCDKPDPGRVTLRRLNRAEYNNSIRDLLGVNFHASDDFPNDDTGYGFDNIGDVLSLSPILLEKYLSAAENILQSAIVTQFQTNGASTRLEAEKLSYTEGANVFERRAVRLFRESELFSSIQLRPGNYLFRARAYGDQAGNEPARMELRVNGTVIKTFDVTTVKDSPAIYETRFNANAGTNRLSAAFINNFRDPQNSDPSRRDRNLIIDFLELTGPSGPQILPETHKRLFPKPVPTSAAARKKYAEEIIGMFAKRAFRRPITEIELKRLMAFSDMAQTEGQNFESGIQLALQAVLVSPHFLFRGELQPDPDNSKSVHLIDEYALASRLSYFLWSSTPDEELMRLAEHGKLRKNLDAQVRRMLGDPKSAAFTKNFAGQWLQLRNLDWIMPDPELFPGFDAALRSDMSTETELFFDSILRENRSMFDLLDANYTFLNERLAKHYGIAGIAGGKFRRVSLKGTPRRGILSQASILTLTSNPTRTSPVKRGKWVLENILGTPPPPPPPNVPDLKEGHGGVLSGTLRQRMEQHRVDPNCSSCHARMDPIGFAFENYDGIGAWRKLDGEFPIDSTGKLVTGEPFNDASELRQILVKQKKEEFVRCVASKMLTYALGRGLEMYDKCAIEKISENVASEDYEIRAFIFEVVKSVPFQMRRGEEHLAQN